MAAKELVWSEYQKAIFQDVETGSGNSIILARAGSSKSTVIVESVNHIKNKKAKILVVAFNKFIQTELEEKINKSYVDCKTLHACGFGVLRSHFGKVAIDPNKAKSIIRSTFPADYSCWEEIFLLDKTVSLAKGMLVDVPSKIDELMDAFDITPADLSRDDFIRRVFDVLQLCRKHKESANFDDMIWMPVVYGMNFPKYDYVFADEAQDFNATQHQIILSSSAKNGRTFICCDNFQAIYQWRGADENSVDTLTKKLNAKTLPLPISYRCPRAIIRLATEYVPDIKAAPNAIEGSVSYIDEKTIVDRVKVGDFILSRTNAPLVEHALNLIKHKIPANIQGRDIGANLKAVIKSSKKKTVDSFLKWTDTWRDDEIKRLTAKHRNTDSVLDRYECIHNLAIGAKSIDDLYKTIDDLFADKDDSNRVILSTVHSAKGLERDNVFLIRRTFRPQSSQEEANIFYVACTRGKINLFIANKS